MLRYDPSKRPSAHQILQHAYFLGMQAPQRPITPIKAEGFHPKSETNNTLDDSKSMIGSGYYQDENSKD